MNKMFKKLMAVSATVAIAATMSVSAFAEEAATTPSASHTAGAVTVNDYVKPANAVDGTTQYTVMLFENSFTGTEVDKIYYINQGTDVSTLLKGMLVKLADGETGLKDGNYTVRIGSDATNATVTNVPLTIAAEDKGIVIYWGDVTGNGGVSDGAITGADATAILMKSAGFIESAKTIKDTSEGSEKTMTLSLGDKIKLTVNDVTIVTVWGDVTGNGGVSDGAITGADATAVLMKSAGFIESAKTIKDITDGSEKTVTISLGDKVSISSFEE